MDSYFIQVESLDNPLLAKVPSAVGGDPNHRGVIATSNYLARSCGIHSAMPSSRALSLCPDLIIVPPRMELYREISQTIRAVFAEYSELVEPLSLDEAYIDVTDSTACGGSATWIAQEIRQKIFEQTGLTSSAGVSSCKFIAKIAADLNKPDGVFVVPPSDIPAFVYDLPLAKIPGVGKVTQEKLTNLQLVTCGDVQQKSLDYLVNRFGKFGHALWQRSHGIDDREVDNNRIRKTVGVETTLDQDIHTKEECITEIHELLPKLLTRLEPHLSNKEIHNVKIKIKFSDFESVSVEQASTHLDKALIPVLLDRALAKSNGRGVRLVGISTGVRLVKEDNQIAFSF